MTLDYGIMVYSLLLWAMQGLYHQPCQVHAIYMAALIVKPKLLTRILEPWILNPKPLLETPKFEALEPQRTLKNPKEP